MFMWVTDSNLDEAMEVMKAWDLSIKQLLLFGIRKKKWKASLFYGVLDDEKLRTCFTWNKRAMTKHLKSQKSKAITGCH